MARSSSKAEQDLETLKSTVSTATALISQLQTSTTPTETETRKTEVNPLNLAHDTASLIRAHSTKLSLLLINQPYTPTAIATVLRELVQGPLPGLASAVELCDGRYTRAMSEELRYEASRIFTELGMLVKAIPLDGKILSDNAKNGTGAKGKGSLAMTGTVWQACDAVIELKKIGIAGLAVRKAEQYKATLKDALEELQEWGEEQGDEEEDVVSGDEDDAQAAIDSMFGPQRHIPVDDPEKIRPRLESSLKRLRLLILMYQAVVKRRFKTLPPLPQSDYGEGALDEVAKQNNPANKRRPLSVVNSVDDVLHVMKKIPDVADELASAFYELDKEEIDRLIDSCFSTGVTVVELLVKDWQGKEDEFTVWAQKFQAAIKMEV